ncbi:hypothetical protein [Thalassorhabdomicrobium marinisediminis]|uniref:Mobilization protein n=1 Tax=Thalassorhabdomicrobium marinisediminis TaxID=2170577 RepID=A0A2T7FZB7_9RHOB|nr:hypothetical protein [Thalassorhabdomicrobium marinisediminis]PVA07517.1 hypothetical protein DC363_02470 [Thalassorhabdomicrobium marinisediminis]
MKNLDTRIQQTQAKLNDLRAMARKQERRNETRRKIIYGAAALKIISQWRKTAGKSEQQQAEESGKADRMMAALHHQVSRDSDREFLGLALDATSSEEGA